MGPYHPIGKIFRATVHNFFYFYYQDEAISLHLTIIYSFNKQMKELIEFIVKHLSDNPDKVIVKEITSDDKSMEFKLKADKSDIGKVIGKKG